MPSLTDGRCAGIRHRSIFSTAGAAAVVTGTRPACAGHAATRSLAARLRFISRVTIGATGE